ncbi:MAG: hypothetical protein JXB07_20685 [Anaerolineae bacterium]|nr:hypothetical protein [Anaerolineae bacterium]
MAIKVEWDTDEKTLVRWNMDSNWTWDEFDRAVDETGVLMDTVFHQVDLLVLSEKSLPPTPNVLPHFMYSQTYPIANDNGGHLVIVGFWQSGIIASIMRAVEKTTPRSKKVFISVQFFEKESEARKFITNNRQ